MSGCIEGILLGALMMKGVDHARQRSDGAEVTGRQQISIEAQEVDSSSTVEYHLKDPHSLANFLKDADIRLVRAQHGSQQAELTGALISHFTYATDLIMRDAPADSAGGDRTPNRTR
eukprot:Skav218171  [mRNA]  locus=scaffold5213:154254:155534:- [translate_table: standard]